MKPVRLNILQLQDLMDSMELLEPPLMFMEALRLSLLASIPGIIT